jgi:Holliday junction resolvase RusA-like endonuclease
MVSNQQHRDWEVAALWQLKAQPAWPDYPATISCVFYNCDNRKRDNSNMLDSVQDVLVKAGVLVGDHWQVLDVGGLHSEIDRKKPRVEIWID